MDHMVRTQLTHGGRADKMATKRAKKTVAFFEVCDEDEDPLEPVDWQSLLGELDDRRVSHGATSLRHTIHGFRHYAQVYTHLETYHLVIAREREEPPSSLDEGSGEILDEQTNANRPWVEISILSFIPDSNVFGFVLGAMGSPRSSAVADWLNADELFEDSLTVRPYISETLVDLVRDGDSEARLFRMKLSAQQLYEGFDPDSGVYSRSQQFGRELDMGPEVDLEITLTLNGNAKSTAESTRRALGDIARSVIGREMVAGKVEVVDLDSGPRVERELVDLVKHHITTKENVSVMDDEGHQVRVPSAVNAISRAISKLGLNSVE